MLIIGCLQLYANFKQGSGEDFSKATQPGTFAFEVRAFDPIPLLAYYLSITNFCG